MRDENNQLCRDFDNWIKQARDEAESVYAQRNAPKGGLVFKNNENALVSRPAAAVEYRSPNFTEEQFDTIAYALHLMRAETRDERDQAIAPLEREIAYLKGQLDALLKLNGVSPPRESKSGANIIDLPNWRRRRDVA